MRTFIAIQIPDDLKEKFIEIQGGIKGYGKIKAVEEENVHITLKFLGDVDENKIDNVVENLNFIQGHKKFGAELKGVGVFPGPDYIRVVWVGVEKGADDIRDIHLQIDENLKKLGFKKDGKFHPHATIARVKFVSNKREFKKFLSSLGKTYFGEFQVDKIELVQSELTPKGPVYTTLKEFELK